MLLFPSITMSIRSVLPSNRERYGYLFLHRTGQVLYACSFPMIQAGACSHISFVDLKKWASPLKQHARLYLQHKRAYQHGLLRCKKRHPYPSGQPSYGAKGIIDSLDIGREVRPFHTSKTLISSANWLIRRMVITAREVLS